MGLSVHRMLKFTILLFIPAVLFAAPEKEFYDYNFDGHLDYRVVSVPNAKGTEFDVFLFDPSTSQFKKDEVLSGTVYPWPDPLLKQVISVWNGGHGGALFSGEVYKWNGETFDLQCTVKQECIQIDGKYYYILVKSKVVDGKSRIMEIRQGDPMWDDNGMHVH